MSLRYREEYLVLDGSTYKSALIAWGAFHLKAKDDGASFKVLEDDATPGRKDPTGLN